MTTEPDLPIAVVGTTSSGKSTLVNLLCGHLVLTPRVQESPRVRVDLRHRHRPHGVTIHDPLSRQAAPIQASTDAACRQALQEVVKRLERVPISQRVDVPILVDLPIGLASGWTCLPPWLRSIAELFAPSDTFPPRIRTPRRLILRDLPGLLDDRSQETRVLISAGLNKAFVLCVFNAAEVDHHKEDQLVRLVFRELRRQCQSWSQVFFVLNRIDLFGRDPGQRDEKSKRISYLGKRITIAAQDEYNLSQRPDPPLIHQIATLPALAAQLLANGRCHREAIDREYLLDVAIDYAGRTVPRGISDQLPRSKERWQRKHVKVFCLHTAVASHWNVFRRALCEHVRELSKGQ
jgi:hypothetical protein